MSLLSDLRKELQQLADPEKAVFLQRFFKTGVGHYGYGDVFLGIVVPDSRKVAKKYKDLPLSEVKELLQFKIHEERLIALLILVYRFQLGTDDEKEKIYNFYLNHTKYINNWDLVDLSADKIVGAYLFNKERKVLRDLAKSETIWERRISIIATYQFIKNGQYQDTIDIAKILIADKHDLIQKAVGWMLREVGKRCSPEVEEAFLKKHYRIMPRTMLRYAIEHFDPQKRKAYLEGLI